MMVEEGQPRGERVALPDAELILYRRVWSREAAAALFTRLLADTAWEQHELQLFGRRVTAPRLSAWYGDRGAVYAYSGVRLSPREWTAPLLAVKGTVETLCGHAFNSVLLNCYRSGSDSMGWHSDDEPELGPEPVIASVSLGAQRALRLRHRREPGITRRLLLPDASVLLMQGATQSCWQHSLPKTRSHCGQRINLTFRTVAPG
ncbi:MAG: alpha-ketoglutarate-dependent dioxygenase AlkB [Gammaproteobacteria bacterium]|nr:alpha-ketoglutarate-dependent dioxygenase AlkB [Gammaproteobacteria bacterium]